MNYSILINLKFLENQLQINLSKDCNMFDNTINNAVIILIKILYKIRIILLYKHLFIWLLENINNIWIKK